MACSILGGDLPEVRARTVAMAEDLDELAFHAQRKGLAVSATTHRTRRARDQRAAIGHGSKLLAVDQIGLGLEPLRFARVDLPGVIARHAPAGVDLDRRNGEVPAGAEPT